MTNAVREMLTMALGGFVFLAWVATLGVSLGGIIIILDHGNIFQW